MKTKILSAIFLILININSNNASEKIISFYGSSGFGTDQSDQSALLSNTIFVGESESNQLNFTHTRNQLKKYAHSHNIILMLEPIFFSSHNFKLLDNYKENWRAYSDIILPYKSKIKAFYNLDEAYMNGISKNISPQEMKLQLEEVARLVKADFSEVPIALSYTTSTVHLSIPEDHDWVGVDCYEDYNLCNGMPMEHYYSILQKQINLNNKGQKLILFPATFFSYFEVSEDLLYKKLTDYRRYLNFASKNPNDIAAIIPFIYQNVREIDIWGLSHFPKLKNEIAKINNEYLEGKFILPPAESLQTPEIFKIEYNKSTRELILVTSNLEDDYWIDIRKLNNLTTTIDWRIHSKDIIVNYLDKKNTKIRFTPSKEMETEIKNHGLNFWAVNPKSQKFSPTPFYLKENITTKTPEIVTGGNGCEDKKCIWLKAKDLDDKIRIEIRKTSSQSLKPDWIISLDQIMIHKDNVISFRMKDQKLIQEFESFGINIWIVNEDSVTFNASPFHLK